MLNSFRSIGRFATRRGLFALMLALLVALLLPVEAMAQSSGSTSLANTTSGIDAAVCAFLGLMQKFGFYVLLFSIIIIAIMIKLGDGRDLIIRGIQIIGGVWLLLNVIAIADIVTGGRLSRAFNCNLA